MIIVLSADHPPSLTDLDRLDRLHAELDGTLDDAQLEPLCQHADDDHVWLDIVAARSLGTAASDDPTFGENFDAMIAYATRSGWLNESGTHVRAHIEATD